MKELRDLLPLDERKAIDHCLAGGNSPIRDLVVQLVDRILMVQKNHNLHVSTNESYLSAFVIHETTKARIEAYRYSLMVACKLQKDADDASLIAVLKTL